MLGKVFRGVISSVTDATSPRRGHSFLHHRTSLVVVTLLFLRRTVLQFALYFVLTHCFVMRVWLLTMWTFVSLHSSVEIFVVIIFFFIFFFYFLFFFLFLFEINHDSYFFIFRQIPRSLPMSVFYFFFIFFLFFIFFFIFSKYFSNSS